MKPVISTPPVFLLMIILTSLLLIPNNAVSDLFPVPHIDEDTAFIYLTTPVKKEKFINKKWGLDFVNSYSIEEHKKGSDLDGEKITTTYETMDKDVGRYKITLEFKITNGRLKQTKFIKEVITFSGKKAFSYKINLDKAGNMFPFDTYAYEINTFLYRGLEMRPKTKYAYYWWATERTAIPLYIKVKRPKKITVPAGTFKCYPLEMYMDVSGYFNKGNYINALINPLLPDMILYFNVEPPHHFIHYKGPIGTPGSMEINLDLVKIVKGRDEIASAKEKLYHDGKL